MGIDMSIMKPNGNRGTSRNNGAHFKGRADAMLTDVTASVRMVACLHRISEAVTRRT